MLEFQTLGRFELYIDGVQVAPAVWGEEPTRTLCKILLTFRCQPVAKSQLQAWLWPGRAAHLTERPLVVAATQLSRVLGSADGPGLVDGDGSLTLMVDPLAVDTDRLYAAAALAIGPNDVISALEAADDLYQGDYLPADAGAPWATIEVQKVSTAYQTVLLKLADAYGLVGEYSAAALACQSLLLINPLSAPGAARLARYRRLADRTAHD